MKDHYQPPLEGRQKKLLKDQFKSSNSRLIREDGGWKESSAQALGRTGSARTAITHKVTHETNAAVTNIPKPSNK